MLSCNKRSLNQFNLNLNYQFKSINVTNFSATYDNNYKASSNVINLMSKTSKFFTSLIKIHILNKYF